MKNNSWEKTRKIYINWLSKNDLRKIFSRNIKYEDLSLWWLTDLINKDNVNKPEWFENLHKTFNNKEPRFIKYKFFYTSQIFKFIKNIFLKIIFTYLIKIFFVEKSNKPNQTKNCFYALFSNFTEYQNKHIDRQYGVYGIKKNKKQFYFLELPENFSIFFNYYKIKKTLSRVPLGYYLSSKNLTIFKIISVYFFCLKQLIKVIFILKKKNYFFLNNKNCEKILKKKLIESFFGSIPDQLLKGIALSNCLKKTDSKNFINCFDFHPYSRSLYYFARKSHIKNIININHFNFSENNIFSNFVKKEFSKNNDCTYYSPKPNIFFCQGAKYFKKIKGIFTTEKVYQVGSFKTELNHSQLSLNKKNIFKNTKKTIVILCSLGDYFSFIKILNLCDLINFKIIVSPHPLKVNQTIYDFKNNFKKDFIIDKTLNKTKLLNNCDFIIFGDTSLGLELSIMNKNIFRIYDKEFIPTFDIDDEVPTATNVMMTEKLLQKKAIKQKSKLLEKNYFYKYDKKASYRFNKILEKI